VAKSTGSSVAVGIGLVASGAVLAFGGVTGRLAAMLAALFYPGALVTATPGNSIPLFPIPAPPESPPASGGGGGAGDVPAPPALPGPASGIGELLPGAPPIVGDILSLGTA
jgi:hypothetical protein